MYEKKHNKINMDDINIKIPQIGKQLTPLIKKINILCKSLDYGVIIHNKQTIYLNNHNKLCIFSILKYLYTNNLLLKPLSSYDSDKQTEFVDIINSDNKSLLLDWINANGRFIMRHLNLLVQTNRIPSNLYNVEIDTNMMNEFVELELMEFIHNKLNYKHIHTISYNNLTIKLTIYSKNKTLPKKMLEDIILRIIICGLFKSTHNNININVDIYLTPFKKKCEYSQGIDVIGPREINSGASITNTKLFIFRQEELNKVLVHELIHYLELDLNEVPFLDCSTYFNISSNNEIRLNEAYTEIMALMINTIIFSDKVDVIKDILNKELKYSMYQSAKILSLFNFKNAHEFFKQCDCDNFRQNTDIFSYFIVKTAILLNLDDFLKLYYNGKITRLNFKEYILAITLSKKYMSLIDKFMKIIHSNKHFLKHPKTLLNTLRMTYYDL
jgi:hypothetical protein